MLFLLLPACVAERRPTSPASAAGGTRHIPRTDIQHAPEPLATPVPASETIRSHLRLAVRPLGSIEYDGQVLPLVSPDGRHIAASIGAAPSWPALLGEPGAAPPAGARIVTYAVPPFEAVRGEDQQTSITRAHELPHAALLLGRSTTDEGFLVESPRPGEDGARWIGFAHWNTGTLDWLVRDTSINANAALANNDALAFTRRKDANSPAELVFLPRAPRLDADQGVPRLDAVHRGAAVRSTPDAESTQPNPARHELTWRPDDPNTTVVAPAFSADNQLYCFVIHTQDTDAVERGVELLCFTLTDAGLTVESRIHLSPSTNPLWIHQALAPMSGWHGSPSRDDARTQPSSLTFFHPGRRNIVTWRPDGAAGFQPAPPEQAADAGESALIDWAAGSVAWAPVAAPGPGPAPAAAFLTTSEGLMYQPNPVTLRTTPDLALARAIATPGIARATTEAAQFLLLAPSRSEGRNALDLYEFRLPADQPPGDQTPHQDP